MSRLLHTLEKIASLLTKYIGLIIICFSVLAFSGVTDLRGRPLILLYFGCCHVRHGADYSYGRF